MTKPVIIPPNTNWDGNDGPWSTFTIQVGSPRQAVRVLPSSSGSTLWAVVPAGCTENDPTNCAELRGGLYDSTTSSTWNQKGIYSLPLATEEVWGYSGNGQFGYETMELSYSGGGGPTLNNTIMSGIATKDFFLGTLGLTPWGVNFTDYNYPVPSILTTLKNETGSLSWAYTAGAYWTSTKTFGSLILGGYDRSRFEGGMSFVRGQDISNDLLVGVQSITTGTQNLLPKAVTALIDSTVAQIWLPEEACSRFEDVFGLVWDETTNLYLVNDTLHEKLLNDNPSVTFTLGQSTTSPNVVNIEMPYGAFDLVAKWPLTANGTNNYFPLRRADNATQYVLGRTFLQSAYLIVDYDQNNFTVAQALYPDTGTPQQVVSLAEIKASKSKSGVSAGLIAGVVIGVLVVIALLSVWFWRKRRSKQRRPETEELLPPPPPPVMTEQDKPPTFKTSEIDGVETPIGSMMKHEYISVEKDASHRYPVETRGDEFAVESGGHQRSELSGDVAAHELQNKNPATEMPTKEHKRNVYEME